MEWSDFIILSVGLILGAGIVWLVSMRGRRNQPGRFSAADLEIGKKAEALLVNNGFAILKKAPQETVITKVGGKTHLGTASADFLVKKSDKTFVAHIHAGEAGADLSDPVLRRKFIESKMAYHPDGLLLVDLAEQSIEEVSFDFPKSGSGFFDWSFRLIQAAFIIGVILGIIWLMVQLKLF